MTLDSMPDYLRTNETADFLRISVGRLARDRLKDKPIPYSKLGRTVLYAKSDLLAYLQANRKAVA